RTIALRVGEQEDVAAQRIALQPVPRHAVQAFEALPHVSSSDCQIDARGSSPAEHLRFPPTRVPTVPAFPHRTPARLQLAVHHALPPPTHYTLRRSLPLTGWIPPRPAMYCCQPQPAVPVVSGNERVYSTPAPAPGKTRCGSIHSTQIPPPTARPHAGSAGVALHTLVAHSCPYFITKFSSRTDGFLGRLHWT